MKLHAILKESNAVSPPPLMTGDDAALVRTIIYAKIFLLLGQWLSFAMGTALLLTGWVLYKDIGTVGDGENVSGSVLLLAGAICLLAFPYFSFKKAEFLTTKINKEYEVTLDRQ